MWLRFNERINNKFCLFATGVVNVKVVENEPLASYVNIICLGQLQEVNPDEYELQKNEELYTFHRAVLDDSNHNKIVDVAERCGRFIDLFSEDVYFNNGNGDVGFRTIPTTFRMSATTQLRFLINDHMKNHAEEPFCKWFFINPKSDPRHAHNKAIKYNPQQVPKITEMKLESFNLDRKKEKFVIDHPSNSEWSPNTKYVDELYDLYENKDQKENENLIKEYSKVL